jgi:hypothetical protein
MGDIWTIVARTPLLGDTRLPTVTEVFPIRPAMGAFTFV